MTEEKKTVVGEAERFLRAEGHAVEYGDYSQMLDMSAQLDPDNEFDQNVQMLVDVMRPKIVARREERFVDGVVAELDARGEQPLTNEDVEYMLQHYRTTYPQMVFKDEDTCHRHYADWIVNHLRAAMPPGVYDGKLVTATADIKFNMRTPEGEEIKRPSSLRTFTSYSGADALVLVNGEVVPETSSINWRQWLKRPYPDGYPLHGEMILTIFGKDSILKELLKQDRKLTLSIVYANEYGQRSLQYFVNPDIKTVDGGMGVDEIIQTETYYFTADDVVLEEMDFSTPITMDDGTINPVFDK